MVGYILQVRFCYFDTLLCCTSQIPSFFNNWAEIAVLVVAKNDSLFALRTALSSQFVG